MSLLSSPATYSISWPYGHGLLETARLYGSLDYIRNVIVLFLRLQYVVYRAFSKGFE